MGDIITTLPNGYEKAPPNIRKAFEDGRVFGKRESVPDRYAIRQKSYEEGALYIYMDPSDAWHGRCDEYCIMRLAYPYKTCLAC